MLTLGFSSMYYTLWEVGEPTKRYTSGTTINGVFTGSFYMEQQCTYMQNLSIDYDAAIEKINERSGGKYAIELDLKGKSSFTRNTGSEGNDMPDYVFSFGKLAGQDIRTATDIWQLKRTMKEERGGRRCVYARRRLIELGELVRSSFDGDNYITPAHFRFLCDKAEKQNKSGHFFENGARIILAVKRMGGCSYDTQYGTVFIEEYLTSDDKIVKYKGSSPLDIDETLFVEIIGTVEHSEYNGVSETRLKRMKIVNKKAATVTAK